MNKLIDPIQNKNDQLILDQLEKVISSPFFKTATKLKKFLRYIVEKSLRGEEKQIKQYTIAVEGLGLPKNFDADSNPMIRIMAGRVRKKLQQYYDIHKDNEVIILMPKGAYVAEFKVQRNSLDSLINYSSVPKLALVCYTDENQTASSNQFVIRLGDYLAQALSQLIYMRLVAFVPYGDKQYFTNSVETIKKDHEVDFIISLNVQEFEENQREFMYRFFDINTLEVYRTETFNISDSAKQKRIHEEIIGDISASLVDINQGLVQINWSRKMEASNETIPLKYQALVYYRHHLDRLCRESFKQAVASCYQILKKNKDDIVANGILAGCSRRECNNGFGIIINPVEVGKKAAEKAKILSPHSLEPHFLLGQMLFSNGEWKQAEEEFKLARRINKYCLTSKFGMGFYLCLMNRWEEGLSLINAVITPRTTVFPSDYYLINFLKYFKQNDFDNALSEAIKITNPHNFHGPFSRCVSYIKMGQYDLASREQLELLKRYPDFMTNGELYLSRFLVNEDYVNTLWNTLLELELELLETASPSLM